MARQGISLGGGKRDYPLTSLENNPAQLLQGISHRNSPTKSSTPGKGGKCVIIIIIIIIIINPIIMIILIMTGDEAVRPLRGARIHSHTCLRATVWSVSNRKTPALLSSNHMKLRIFSYLLSPMLAL
ncbi:unnamed protein product [Pleuronectes platessa]|uniref:Uncharacterized protein n=1 Tax=Pleuronectes platessa TaxID=8262 RepID=A0A9N7TZN1_PLEPL|nr:unnamed protein product [Pleuronectes platessa]